MESDIMLKNLCGGIFMKKFLCIMAAVFGVLTIIFYISSLNHLDYETARIWGTSTVINIQATVFCAACAVICALNVVGAAILSFIEYYAVPSTPSNSATGIRTDDGGVKLTSGSYWVCPKCKAHNPFSKIECRECGHVR